MASTSWSVLVLLFFGLVLAVNCAPFNDRIHNEPTDSELEEILELLRIQNRIDELDAEEGLRADGTTTEEEIESKEWGKAWSPVFGKEKNDPEVAETTDLEANPGDQLEKDKGDSQGQVKDKDNVANPDKDENGNPMSELVAEERPKKNRLSFADFMKLKLEMNQELKNKDDGNEDEGMDATVEDELMAAGNKATSDEEKVSEQLLNVETQWGNSVNRENVGKTETKTSDDSTDGKDDEMGANGVTLSHHEMNAEPAKALEEPAISQPEVYAENSKAENKDALAEQETNDGAAQSPLVSEDKIEETEDLEEEQELDELLVKWEKGVLSKQLQGVAFSTDNFQDQAEEDIAEDTKIEDFKTNNLNSGKEVEEKAAIGEESEQKLAMKEEAPDQTPEVVAEIEEGAVNEAAVEEAGKHGSRESMEEAVAKENGAVANQDQKVESDEENDLTPAVAEAEAEEKPAFETEVDKQGSEPTKQQVDNGKMQDIQEKPESGVVDASDTKEAADSARKTGGKAAKTKTLRNSQDGAPITGEEFEQMDSDSKADKLDGELEANISPVKGLSDHEIVVQLMKFVKKIDSELEKWEIASKSNDGNKLDATVLDSGVGKEEKGQTDIGLETVSEDGENVLTGKVQEKKATEDVGVETGKLEQHKAPEIAKVEDEGKAKEETKIQVPAAESEMENTEVHKTPEIAKEEDGDNAKEEGQVSAAEGETVQVKHQKAPEMAEEEDEGKTKEKSQVSAADVETEKVEHQTASDTAKAGQTDTKATLKVQKTASSTETKDKPTYAAVKTSVNVEHSVGNKALDAGEENQQDMEKQPVETSEEKTQLEEENSDKVTGKMGEDKSTDAAVKTSSKVEHADENTENANGEQKYLVIDAVEENQQALDDTSEEKSQVEAGNSDDKVTGETDKVNIGMTGDNLKETELAASDVNVENAVLDSQEESVKAGNAEEVNKPQQVLDVQSNISEDEPKVEEDADVKTNVDEPESKVEKISADSKIDNVDSPSFDVEDQESAEPLDGGKAKFVEKAADVKGAVPVVASKVGGTDDAVSNEGINEQGVSDVKSETSVKAKMEDVEVSNDQVLSKTPEGKIDGVQGASQVNEEPGAINYDKDLDTSNTNVAVHEHLAASLEDFEYARCDLRANNFPFSPLAVKNHVTGHLVFKQKKSGGAMEVKASFYGLDTEGPVEHVIDVHEFGDLSNGCQSTGERYVGTGTAIGQAHSLGDSGGLGSVRRDESGSVRAAWAASSLGLVSEDSILGRAIVVHAQTDSGQRSGEAGVAKLGCCIVARSSDVTPWI